MIVGIYWWAVPCYFSPYKCISTLMSRDDQRGSKETTFAVLINFMTPVTFRVMSSSNLRLSWEQFLLQPTSKESWNTCFPAKFLINVTYFGMFPIYNSKDCDQGPFGFWPNKDFHPKIRGQCRVESSEYKALTTSIVVGEGVLKTFLWEKNWSNSGKGQDSDLESFFHLRF